MQTAKPLRRRSITKGKVSINSRNSDRTRQPDSAHTFGTAGVGSDALIYYQAASPLVVRTQLNN